jgi:hypothetical protein
MQRTELDSLMSQYKIEFCWDETHKEWWLSGKPFGNSQKTDPRTAGNIDIAKDAAAHYFKTNFIHPKNNNASFPELDALLSKHRMSFHWSSAKSIWFVIWQEKESNALVSSKPRVALDRWEAQVEAAELISRKFREEL